MRIPPVALLYQAAPPPVIDGVIKPMKPGGYSDSGADIAFALRRRGIPVVTPALQPQVERDLDWVYPDTHEGIQTALDAGAECLWLNTVLYASHPVCDFGARDIRIVGQVPGLTERYDDKWETNQLLKACGLPVSDSTLLGVENFREMRKELRFPLVVKPVRGRGSQGVRLLGSPDEYETALEEAFSSGRYGRYMIAETYLPGQELTVTVMPPGVYEIGGREVRKDGPWCLPAVERMKHREGIIPYSGTVAVVYNSRVLEDEEERGSAMPELYDWCSAAARLAGLKAPVRIDCRAGADGKYYLFDLNMKPNMTGASRPHRPDQDSLVAMAARAFGWTYPDLLWNMLKNAWKLG